MGENDASHPTGILSGFSDCCTREPLGETGGDTLAIGRRSLLNSRFTENGVALFAATPAPALGSPKSGRKPRKNKASAVIPNALAIRISSLAIGPLRRTDAIVPTIDQAHENPPEPTTTVS
jgi:hypothetical protein